VVEVKFGFIELSAIDTINQSFRCRFFLDLTWEDPRLIGASSVPDGTWFPKGVYIINAHGALDIAAYSKPILVDSATGRVLWAQDIQGAITNQMSLAAFPFDTDVLEVYVHQAEEASRDDVPARGNSVSRGSLVDVANVRLRRRHANNKAQLPSPVLAVFFDPSL
jgi:hypothetical protein